MALIRKQQAGSDSFGHSWPEDGAVVDIDDGEQIASLMAIPDGGFSEVTPAAEETPEDPPRGDPHPHDPNADAQEKQEISEVDPNAPAAEPDVKPEPAAKKTAARKTTTSKPE